VKDTLKRLVTVYGPPGRESAVAGEITTLVKPHVDEVCTDSLGNVIATIGPMGVSDAAGGADGQAAPEVVMISAHMDQAGFIVTEIDGQGRLRFSPVGRCEPVSFVGVKVLSGGGTAGIVACDEGTDWKDLSPDRMHIDTGATGKDEALGLAAVGDVFCPVSELTELSPDGKTLVSPALDDRAGCAVLIETARRLTKTAGTVHFVFTVQGAVAPRGARPAAYALQPDLGLSVDVTPAGGSRGRSEVAVGKGPAVRVKDGGYVAPVAVRERLTRAAEAAGVPYQLEVLSSGGHAADAAAMQSARAGVPTGAIGLPARHVGTPTPALSLTDLEGTVRLLLEFLR